MTELNRYSSRITQPKYQGVSQAMLYATGLKEEDMNKPQVGIASVWWEGNPCNMHLLDLGAQGEGGGRVDWNGGTATSIRLASVMGSRWEPTACRIPFSLAI